jgi:preprotein translocase subunit SecG
MTIVFLILIILACAVLGFIVLVQNPKGGGLAGSFAGISNQFMGVKQTTDVLEKGTWIFAAIIGALCLASTFFMSGESMTKAPDAAAPTQQQLPQPQLPTGTQPNPAAPTK